MLLKGCSLVLSPLTCCTRIQVTFLYQCLGCLSSLQLSMRKRCARIAAFFQNGVPTTQNIVMKSHFPDVLLIKNRFIINQMSVYVDIKVPLMFHNVGYKIIVVSRNLTNCSYLHKHPYDIEPLHDLFVNCLPPCHSHVYGSLVRWPGKSLPVRILGLYWCHAGMPYPSSLLFP